ncbi:MAG: pilin [Candidatus Kuenenbacteria bacterium]
MSKKFLSFFLFLFILSFVFIPIYANAAESIFGTLPGCFDSPPTECSICDIIRMVVGLAKYILGFIGALALLLFIWGGFGLIISAGNEEKVKKNKGILIGTLVGILIILAAWQMVWVVLVTLIPNTSTTVMLGKNIKWNSWNNWDAICATPPPPVTKAVRWAKCTKDSDECDEKLRLRCAKEFGKESFICAENRTVALYSECYPLDNKQSECMTGLCAKELNKTSSICAKNKTVELNGACRPLEDPDSECKAGLVCYTLKCKTVAP